MTSRIKLFCILDGDSSAFEVKLDADDSIAALKKAIKEEKPSDFQDLDADKLLLYQIAIPDEGTQVNLNNVDSPKPLLKATTEIAEVFGTAPPKKTIHVIVRRPSAGKRCSKLLHYIIHS